ncbi:MAG: hypothetical protein LBU18_01155 [Treponema sp.]|jgi:hypothetical protein|nr:hypothetical protein [Treponema sp.]
MAHVHDYIPEKDADFDGWFENFKNYVVEMTGGRPPVWTHIPAEKVTGLGARFDAWRAAFQKTKGPHTSVDTEIKNEEKAAALDFIRPFVNQYLRFDPVTDAQRSAAGVNNHDPNRTPVGDPATRPGITGVKPLGGGRVELHFKDEKVEHSQAIPYGMNGCLLSYALSDGEIADLKLFKTTKLLTHSPFVLHLGSEAEGKVLSFALCWQNEKGGLGDNSAASHVVVS